MQLCFILMLIEIRRVVWCYGVDYVGSNHMNDFFTNLEESEDHGDAAVSDVAADNGNNSVSVTSPSPESHTPHFMQTEGHPLIQMGRQLLPNRAKEQQLNHTFKATTIPVLLKRGGQSPVAPRNLTPIQLKGPSYQASSDLSSPLLTASSSSPKLNAPNFLHTVIPSLLKTRNPTAGKSLAHYSKENSKQGSEGRRVPKDDSNFINSENQSSDTWAQSYLALEGQKYSEDPADSPMDSPNFGLGYPQMGAQSYQHHFTITPQLQPGASLLLPDWIEGPEISTGGGGNGIGGIDDVTSSVSPNVIHDQEETNSLDQLCLGRVVGDSYTPLNEWYDDTCRKYRCELIDNKYQIMIDACEKPSAPPSAIECREYRLDGKSVKFPSCCPRLRCVVSYHGKKFIQIVGQEETPHQQRSSKRGSRLSDRSVSGESDFNSIVTPTAEPIQDGEETPIQIIKRAEEEFVRTLGFSQHQSESESGRGRDRDRTSPISTSIPRDMDPPHRDETRKLMSQVSDQMCDGTERRRRRYTPLRVWYDDACHKYRCEILNGKYHIAVIGCVKPEAPINAIQCNEYNLDNENVMYPVCCPRLRCVVVIKGEMYVRISGQPEEDFPDVPLKTMQPGSTYNLTGVAKLPDGNTNSPVTYYYPKQAEEYLSDPIEQASRNRPEAPLPILNMNLDWKHNVLTEYIHRGVIKALQYLKESL